MIDTSASIRPTRHRLFAAMGVSVCVVMLLLVSVGLLMDFSTRVSKTAGDRSESLTVHIHNKASQEAPPELTVHRDAPVPSEGYEEVASADLSDTETEAQAGGISEPPGETQPSRDWRAIAAQVARATLDDYSRERETTEALWRRSPSIMFERADGPSFTDAEPVIADLRFVPEIHVLGLGLTIGSCFVGVPIAGVPVEQRNVAITLFVCAEGS